MEEYETIGAMYNIEDVNISLEPEGSAVLSSTAKTEVDSVGIVKQQQIDKVLAEEKPVATKTDSVSENDSSSDALDRVLDEALSQMSN